MHPTECPSLHLSFRMSKTRPGDLLCHA
jgi:hypothetical protein